MARRRLHGHDVRINNTITTQRCPFEHDIERYQGGYFWRESEVNAANTCRQSAQGFLRIEIGELDTWLKRGVSGGHLGREHKRVLSIAGVGQGQQEAMLFAHVEGKGFVRGAWQRFNQRQVRTVHLQHVKADVERGIGVDGVRICEEVAFRHGV